MDENQYITRGFQKLWDKLPYWLKLETPLKPKINMIESQPPKTEQVKGALEVEEEAIGDLKDKFRTSDLSGQRKVKFSIADILGAISLAYWRGKQSTPTEDKTKT